jgi:hypothetical protein
LVIYIKYKKLKYIIENLIKLTVFFILKFY